MGEYLTLGEAMAALNSFDGDLFVVPISGTFSVGEQITGGDSSATAYINRIKNVSTGVYIYEISFPSAAFDDGETITGGTSSATATFQFADHNLLDDMIDRSEDHIEHRTNAKWNTTTETQTDKFRLRRDENTVWLRRTPVTAISTIKINGSEWTDAVLDDNYHLNDKTGKFSVVRGRLAPTTFGDSLEITYTWGEAGTPARLKQAVLGIVKSMWTNYIAFVQTRGAESVGMSDFRVKYNPIPVVPVEVEDIVQDLTHIMVG